MEVGEVSIKVTLDDSGVGVKLENLKKDLKSIGATAARVDTSKMSSGIKKAANAAKEVKREITKTKDCMGKVSSKTKETTTEVKHLKNGIVQINKSINITNDSLKKQKSLIKQEQSAIRNKLNAEKQVTKELEHQRKERANNKKNDARMFADAERKALNQQRDALKDKLALERQVTKELERQEQARINADIKDRIQHGKNDIRMNSQYESYSNSSIGKKIGLNDVLLKSMKILRITTTITAVYALIKTAVRAWEKTVRAVMSAYKELITLIAKTVAGIAKFTYSLSGAKAVVEVFKSIFDSIAGKVKEAFSVEGIKDFISGANELASDLIEVENIIDRINSAATASKVSDWASTISDTFGLNELNAKKYEGTFSAIFNSSGFDESTYTRMAKDLTQATSDLASLYNFDFDDVFKKIQSGMAGQTKSMMTLGISLHKATLEEYMLANGITASYNSLTNAEKQYVRYQYILKATRDYQGDFNDTQWQYANNMRVISQHIETLKIQLGTIINSILVPLAATLRVVLQYIIELISSLQIVEKLVASIQGLFSGWGFDFDNTSLAGIGEDAADMFDEMEDEAAETAAQIKRSLSSFDELHQLKGDDDSSTSGIDFEALKNALNESYKAIEAKEPAFVQKIKDMLDKIKEAWNNGDFTNIGKIVAQKLKDALMWVNSKKAEIFGVLKNFGKSLATFINGLFEDPTLFSELAKTILLAIEGIMVTVKEFFDNLKGSSIGTAIASFINEIFKPDEDGMTGLDYFVEMLASGINKISEILSGFTNNFNKETAGLSIAKAIDTLFSSVKWEEVGQSIGQFATKLLSTLSLALHNVNWKQVGLSINDFIKGIFTPNEDGNTILDAASDVIVTFVNGLVAAAKEVFSGDGLTRMNQEIKEFFETIGNNINWDDLGEIAGALLDELQLVIQSAMDSIDWKALIPSIISGLEMIIEGVTKFLAGALLLLGVTTLKFMWDDVIYPINALVVSAILALGTKLLVIVKDIIVGLVENIVGFCKTIKEGYLLFKEWIIEKVKELFTSVVEAFTTFKTNIKTKTDEIKTDVSGKISSIKETIGTFKENVLNIMKDLWSGIKNVFSGVADWFKGIFEDAANGIKGAMDKVKSWFGWGDEDISINTNSTSSFPHYAQGGYVRRNMPQLAVVGDNTSEGEIITPESKMYEISLKAMTDFFQSAGFANAMASAFAGTGGSGDVTVPLYLDSTVLGKAMITQEQMHNARGRR